ncbi:MAG: tripartite tricarboxylate transporter substrate binding protein [Desulfovibrionaceae bacterium]|jgi:tripartite-type tricarboxylate transporter receptor subunit TctC|nr:tripartite tricarboxylate transporter substrate binding protein [Desulfovibrionaceae bacterium]
MKRLDRRRWLGHALAGALGAWPLHDAMAAFSESPFPSQPISLWVPWPPGGATDVSLRLLAQIASQSLGQTVIVKNRSGAGGILAMPLLQTAPPDGYTIAQMPQPVFHAPHVQKVPWDPIRDVTPIIQISSVTFGVLVAGGSSMRSLDDLFAFARKYPGELTIATNGVGTTPHIVLEQLFTARGLRYIHVPYKGTAEQLNAIASGQVMAGVNSSGFGPAVDAAILRLLVIFTAERSRRWPQVPTLRELGIDIVAKSPYGLAGPRGLPPHVVSVLHDAFKQAVFDPRFQTELVKYDQEIDYLGPEAYAQSCRNIYEQERVAVEKMGLANQGD